MTERKPRAPSAKLPAPPTQTFTSAPILPAHQMPPFEPADLYAIHALIEGRATKDQQRRFVEWFDRATGANQNPYRPGGEEAQRDTDLACGRRFVGDWFYAIARTQLVQEGEKQQ